MELSKLKARNQQLFAENEAISEENMQLRKKLRKYVKRFNSIQMSFFTCTMIANKMQNEHRKIMIEPPLNASNIEVIASNSRSKSNVIPAEQTQLGGGENGK